MNLIRSLLRARNGAAAVEMAIIAPLMLAIGCGSVEVGNFMLDEHRLVKSVRDAARYAGRQPFTTYSMCTATGATVASTTQIAQDVTALVHTHQLSSGTDQLPNWTSGNIVLTATCDTIQKNSQTMSGVYSGTSCASGSNCWFTVTVAATLPYQPVIGAFGFSGRGLSLHAEEQAAVTGV